MPEPDAFPWPVRVLGVVLAACYVPFYVVGAILSGTGDLFRAVLCSASETFDQWHRQFSRWLRKWLGRR